MPALSYADRVCAAYGRALRATRPLRGEARLQARVRLSAEFFRLMVLAREIEGARPFAVAL